MSELLLYQNKIYQEAQIFEQSIKHLDENKNYILDKLSLLEKKGFLKKKKKLFQNLKFFNHLAFALKQLNKNAEAAVIYEELIDRNPDNLFYFQSLEVCYNLGIVNI